MKMNGNQMKSQKWNGVVLAVLLVIAGAGITIGESDSSKTALASDHAIQITFSSPAEAGTALAQAMGSGNLAALTKVIGNDASALVTSKDEASDQAAMHRFFSKYQQMNRWVNMTDGSQVLYIGSDNFAFPVPLAKTGGDRWYFDAVAGAQEIRARDIGRNELLTIDSCGALATAEELYLANSGSGEFAQRIISTPGKQDGLYWPTSDSAGVSPIQYLDEFPQASLASVSPDQPFVVDGYAIRILAAQGQDTPGGAKSYIVNGKMTRGFAILATPVKYGETGITSFMVNRKGTIYERDLGPATAKIATSMQEYNPGDQWSPIE
jgi:hypothetical protein